MKTYETTILVFGTESGSSYEINQGRVRRVNLSAEKRGDGVFHRLVEMPEIFYGTPVTLAMEDFPQYGPDDLGFSEGPSITVRVTAPVEGVEVERW